MNDPTTLAEIFRRLEGKEVSETDNFKELLREAEDRLSKRNAEWRTWDVNVLYREADAALNEMVIKGRSHDLLFEVLVLTAQARAADTDLNRGASS